MGIKDLSPGFIANIGRMSDIINPGDKKSGVSAYYSRKRDEDGGDEQQFVPPLIGKKPMSLDEEELYHEGIHEICLELVLQNLS